MNTFLEELNWRGLIYQKTPGIEKVFERGTTVYLGFDAQGDSFHIGHLLWIAFLKRALLYKNKITVLTGGGTSMVGDPSGKEKERPILPKEMIEANKKKLQAQLARFLEADDAHVQMVDNTEWLEKVTLIDFLREAGKYISINSMLDKDSVKNRLGREDGLSFTEFTYQLLQAYDFMELYQTYKCEVQVGGSDQWGNMIQGVELIRKKLSKEAHTLSFPLIVNPKTGKKFGKTEEGIAIWLDPEKTHPFAFYQFLVNTDDELAPILIKYYSFKTKEEIDGVIAQWEKEKEKRFLQRQLAYELTSMVHGHDVAEECKKVAQLLFESGLGMIQKEDLDFVAKALPYTSVKNKNDFNLEQSLVDLGLVKSKGDARRLVEQNGAHSEFLFEKYFLIKKGKREYGVVEVK